MKRELAIPPAAEEDPSAFEILRVWGAKRKQHLSLFWDLWNDPATWGIMLADLAGHVANALNQERGLDRQEVLSEIRSMFNKELDAPTDSPEGKIMNKRRSHRRTQNI
jgi:hypothetical protein